MSKTNTAAGALNLEMLLRQNKLEDSFCPEDDYVMGFIEGQRNGEFRIKMLMEALDGLINVAAARQEKHSMSYALFIKRRFGL